MGPLAAAVLAALAAPAAAAWAPWTLQGASLVLRDSSGTVAGEIGLGSWEEPSAAGLSALEIRGGAAPGGRFAWTLETRALWNTARTKRRETGRTFRLLGSAGAELWSSAEPDLPTRGEPVRFSSDGERLLVACRREKDWVVRLQSYLGNVLHELGPFPRVKSLRLSPSGGYAAVSWEDPERSATHSFLEAATGRRRDIPSEDLLLGEADVSDDGKVSSGGRVLHDFSAPEPKP